ncbi:MAG: hypothetical protein PHQ28_12590 [Mycobacterium sp.]|nr:hypothetical protein [Mycobacterium sp.]
MTYDASMRVWRTMGTAAGSAAVEVNEGEMVVHIVHRRRLRRSPTWRRAAT